MICLVVRVFVEGPVELREEDDRGDVYLRVFDVAPKGGGQEGGRGRHA